MAAGEPKAQRTYANRLTRIADPRPLLADYPEFVQPVRETVRYEAPVLVDDKDADLHVRAWRFSYNARGIIEIPNRLRAAETALIMVHPWGIDDGQGWKTPEPAGAADFCTPEKNHLAGKHTRTVIDPFLKSLRRTLTYRPLRWKCNETIRLLSLLSVKLTKLKMKFFRMMTSLLPMRLTVMMFCVFAILSPDPEFEWPVFGVMKNILQL